MTFSALDILAPLVTLMVLALTVAAAVCDLRRMRIPNLYSVIVMAAFAVAFAVSPEGFRPWWDHVGAFALMFGATFWMFSVGMMGGGDTKFASALALWVGLKGLMLFLLAMTAFGGVLGLIAWGMRRRPLVGVYTPGSWFARLQAGDSVVPYGVAIAAGFWVFVFHTRLIHHSLDELFKIAL